MYMYTSTQLCTKVGTLQKEINMTCAVRQGDSVMHVAWFMVWYVLGLVINIEYRYSKAYLTSLFNKISQV